MFRIRAVPVLKTPLPTEFVQLPTSSRIDDKLSVAAQAFNMTWQSGGAWGDWRSGFLRLKEPDDFRASNRIRAMRREGKCGANSDRGWRGPLLHSTFFCTNFFRFASKA
jgi:hypothetical protein